MPKKKTQSLEDSLKRIEEITTELESQTISLEKSVELYKEGSELIFNCNKLIKDAELTISKIKFDAENDNSGDSSDE